MNLFQNMPMRGFPQAPRGMMFSGFGPMNTQTPPFMPDQPAPAPAAPATWAKGGAGWDAVGAIGNTLMSLSGDPALSAWAQQNRGQQQQDRQFQQAQIARTQMAQQERAADQRTWIDRQLFERANPAPRAPHYWETNNGSLAMVDPVTGQPRVVYEDPTPKVTWTQVDLPNGQKQLIPSINGVMSGGGSPAPAAPPTKPVGKLTPIQGGATPSGSRPF